jgi:hypothetical protein
MSTQEEHNVAAQRALDVAVCDIYTKVLTAALTIDTHVPLDEGSSAGMRDAFKGAVIADEIHERGTTFRLTVPSAKGSWLDLMSEFCTRVGDSAVFVASPVQGFTQDEQEHIDSTVRSARELLESLSTATLAKHGQRIWTDATAMEDVSRRISSYWDETQDPYLSLARAKEASTTWLDVESNGVPNVALERARTLSAAVQGKRELLRQVPSALRNARLSLAEKLPTAYLWQRAIRCSNEAVSHRSNELDTAKRSAANFGDEQAKIAYWDEVAIACSLYDTALLTSLVALRQTPKTEGDELDQLTKEIHRAVHEDATAVTSGVRGSTQS